jgi:hypothetical protein
MSAMTATSVYEEHVRALPASERLKLLSLIASDLSDAAPASGTRRRSILELRGLGKELWEGIDAQEYVNQLRREWDERSA